MLLSVNCCPHSLRCNAKRACSRPPPGMLKCTPATSAFKSLLCQHGAFTAQEHAVHTHLN